MTPPDYSTWLTKQQAAEAIGVSTKTIEAFAQDHRIEQAAWRPEGRGAAKAVYNPDDVARMAQERQPGRPAFVLPAEQTGKVNGTTQVGSHALALPAGDDPIRQLFAAALRAVLSAPSPTVPAAGRPDTSENSEKLFLTLAEASAYAGLSQNYLRRLIKDKTLAAIRDRGWRIRRRDLEQL